MIVTPAAMAARMRAVSTVLAAATRRTLAGSRPTRRAACHIRSCTRATFCAIERTLSGLCVSVSSIANPHHEYPYPVYGNMYATLSCPSPAWRGQEALSYLFLTTVTLALCEHQC